MFQLVWNMILGFWGDVLAIEFISGTNLLDVVLAFFTFVMFIKFFLAPAIGGKVL